LADAQGIVIVSVESQYPAGTKLPDLTLREGDAILVDNKQVGTLLITRQLPGFNPEESRFLDRTNEALALAIGAALFVALMIGIMLARTLTRPLHALTIAAQRIADGKLEQQVNVNSQDEIGKLGAAFNRMSQEVARVNQMRRQMTADIAHDLRTPLTVIAGYIESMRDGVLQPTPQRLDLIYTEIERLQNLVGDLRVLSQADAGELPLNPQHISPKNLLDHAAEVFQHQAEQNGITLVVEVDTKTPDIKVDEARMMQVMDNLVSNAFRYTPSGGKIQLSASESRGKVKIAVSDTGTGIVPEEIPFIFDRFHRADKSRHSEMGESGLGLAIVKALVESNGGLVFAESTIGKGTSIQILLPAA
jgi:signal transduction histidine kinase